MVNTQFPEAAYLDSTNQGIFIYTFIEQSEQMHYLSSFTECFLPQIGNPLSLGGLHRGPRMSDDIVSALLFPVS